MARNKKNKDINSCIGACVIIALLLYIFSKTKYFLLITAFLLIIFFVVKQIKQKNSNRHTTANQPFKTNYSFLQNSNTVKTTDTYIPDTTTVIFIEVIVFPNDVSETKKTYVSVDIDTTGLDKNNDKIIGISAIKYIDGCPVNQFHEFINPGFQLSLETTEITGITDEMISTARSAKEVLSSFISFIKRDDNKTPLLCIHYAGFIMGFLENSLRSNHVSAEIKYIDIMTTAGYCYPNLKSKKLSDICDASEVEYQKNEGSLSDAIAIGNIFTNMIEFHPDNLTKWSLYKDKEPIKKFIVTKSNEKLYDLCLFPSMFYVGSEAKIKNNYFEEYYYLTFDGRTEYCKVPKRICEFLDENGYDNQYFVIDKQETEDDKFKLKIGIYK